MMTREQIRTEVFRHRVRQHYFYLRCDNLADRGFNTAIEVYMLRPNQYPLYIGANYRLNTAGWAGERTEARKIIRNVVGHKIESCNRESWVSSKVKLKDINGN